MLIEEDKKKCDIYMLHEVDTNHKLSTVDNK